MTGRSNGAAGANGAADARGAGRTVRVLRGNPTPEELAAALAVVQARLAAASAAAGADAPPTAAEWSSPLRTAQRARPTPGPDAWRTTYWPG